MANNTPMKYDKEKGLVDELAPSVVTAHKDNIISPVDEEQALMAQYKPEFDATKEGKALIIEGWKTSPSDKTSWQIKYNTALLNYVKAKMMSFKNGGTLRKYQNAGILPANWNTSLGEQPNLYIPRISMVQPDYPSDEMVALNQEYEALVKAVEEGKTLPSVAQIKLEKLQQRAQELIDAKRSTVGETTPGYRTEYDKWAQENTKTSIDDLNRGMEPFRENQRAYLFNKYGYETPDEGVHDPIEMQRLAEAQERMKATEGRLGALTRNYQFGFNYSPEEWEEIDNYMQNGFYSDGQPKNARESWSPMYGGTLASTANNQAWALRASRPSYQSIASKYPDYFNLLRTSNSKESGLYDLGAAAVGTIAAAPTASMYALLGGSVAHNAYNLGKSYIKDGFGVSPELNAQRKEWAKDLGINSAFLALPFIGAAGRSLRTPRAIADLNKFTGNYIFKPGLLGKSATGPGFYGWNPNTFGKTLGYGLEHGMDLAFTGLGAYGAGDMLGTYTWNKGKYSPDELRQRRINDGVLMGFGIPSAFSAVRGLKGISPTVTATLFEPYKQIGTRNYGNLLPAAK